MLPSNMNKPEISFTDDKGNLYRLDITSDYTQWYCWSIGRKIVTKEDFIPKEIIYTPPYTICIFSNGERVVSKCGDGEEFSKEIGVASCIAKNLYGGRNKFMNVVNEGSVHPSKEEKQRKRQERIAKKKEENE